MKEVELVIKIPAEAVDLIRIGASAAAIITFFYLLLGLYDYLTWYSDILEG